MLVTTIAFSLLFTWILAQSSESSCKKGTFFSDGSCKLCPPGTYQNKARAASCLPCPAGFFNPLRGAQTVEVCNPCPQDSFSEAGASSCTKCSRDTVSPPGSDRCLSCPTGQAPTRCPFRSNFFSNNFALQKPGECQVLLGEQLFIEPLLSLQCVPCTEGTFSPPSSRECSFCPPDMTAPQEAARCSPRKTCGPGETNIDDHCVPCADFMFRAGSMTACGFCADGFRGNKRNGATRCVLCPAGTAGRDGRCRRCREAENTDVLGATDCMPDDTECPSNFFRDARGACKQCTKAERFDRKQKLCVPCSPDEQSNGGFDTKCKKCPPNSEVAPSPTVFKVGESLGVFFIDGDYNRTPRCVCKEGFMWMPNGRCQPCPPGFKNSRGIPVGERNGDLIQQLVCYSCNAGDFARGKGNINCSSCPAQKVSLVGGQSKCKKCPSGLVARTVPERRTGDSCVNPLTNKQPPSLPTPLPRKTCEGNTVDYRQFLPNTCDCVSTIFSRQIRNGKCELCPPGTIGRFGISGCKPCPAGTFSAEEGSLKCSSCPPGTFSRTGARECSRCPGGLTTFIPGSANCVKPGSS